MSPWVSEQQKSASSGSQPLFRGSTGACAAAAISLLGCFCCWSWVKRLATCACTELCVGCVVKPSEEGPEQPSGGGPWDPWHSGSCCLVRWWGRPASTEMAKVMADLWDLARWSLEQPAPCSPHSSPTWIVALWIKNLTWSKEKLLIGSKLTAWHVFPLHLY